MQPVQNVLQNANQLKGYSYKYKTQQDKETNVFGFMAQEVEPLFPELAPINEDGY